jgi:GTP-binding protein
MSVRKDEPDAAAIRFRAAEFLVAAHRPADWPADEGAEVAFIGRSNSGKSSAINAITGRKGLARASKEPGRTRQIVFFKVPGGRLVDLPGYGYANVAPELRRHWDTAIASYLEGRSSLRGVVLIADIRRGVAGTERGFIEWCARADLPVLCLLSKADKLSRSGRDRALQAIRTNHPGLAAQTLSVLSGEGIEDARRALDKLLIAE